MSEESQTNAGEPISQGICIYGVEFTDEGIFELDGGVRALFIDKAVIRKCAFRKGLVAERALVVLVVGLVMATGGAVALCGMPFLGVLDHPRPVGYVVVAAVALFALGLVLVRQAMRRGIYLELETERGLRKLTVGKSVALSDLQAALPAVGKRFGYVVELAVEGSGLGPSG